MKNRLFGMLLISHFPCSSLPLNFLEFAKHKNVFHVDKKPDIENYIFL